MERDEQLHARIAWLYHMEEMTQAEIAERLGLTRLRVNRMLAECRSQGIVRVSLNTRFARCVELESALRRRFDLDEAVVIPTSEDPERIHAQLGQAAGAFLSQHIARNAVRSIGVGWGATLREAIRAMEPMDLPGVSVVSVMGGLTRGSELNTFEIAGELARRLGASCLYLAAPIYAGSARSRDTILMQDVFADILARGRSAEVAFLSLGDLSTRSLLIRHGLPPDVTPEELRRAGAVGDVLGQFIDARGRPIDHAVNQRMVGLQLDQLSRIPTVVLAAGGLHKAPVIAATLHGRLARVLISDERTVEEALACADRQG